LIIIGKIIHHKGDNQSIYTNNIGLFEQKLLEFPHIPHDSHLYWNAFKDGLIYIHQMISTAERSQATESCGGFGSNDYRPALIQTFFTLSNLTN